jgi:sortase A
VTGVITRIVAESIELDAEVVDVGWQTAIQNGVTVNVWAVADEAAGWHKNSALPGKGGNIVLSGHHNINGEVFRYIVDLEPGAVVTLYEGDQTYRYLVEDKFIVRDRDQPEAVRRENAKWIGSFNEERLTLVTCWPYTNNTHRVIVIAKPAPPS